MASLSSSPATRATPEPLTPRSKIKALLATVDSSDEEGSPLKNLSSESRTENARRPQQLEQSHASALDQDDSDESEEEIRPRGRLASKMQGGPRPTSPQNKNHGETARERVKKMLQRDESETAQVDDVEMAHADSENEDLPVAPRRLVRSAARGATPEDTNARKSKSPSPGLFVSSPTRPSPAKSTQENQDSDEDLPTLKSDRFKALVERKRQERLAREAEEEAKRAEKLAQREKLASELEQLASDEDSGITDDEGGRQLTQKGRPSARKASKKAIEEMNRETQRMKRSMQLAHEVKTRKKITKNSLFERFNFRPAGEPEPKVSSSSRPATPQSDVEMQDVDTPPSSPPIAKKPTDVDTQREAQVDLPSVEELAETTTLRQDKGKGKEVDVPEQPQEQQQQQPAKLKQRVRVMLPPLSARAVMLDSDDELEITATTKDKVKAVFDSIPLKKAKESHSLQALRALAQVRSPGKESRRKNENAGMTAGELQTYLQQRARQQAKIERDRRVESLKAQGVVIQTAEERERQEQEVEDIVARARQEAQKIMEQERAEAKDNDDGTVDPLAWDDSEDEEYKASGDEADAELSAVELSGSEDDQEEGDEQEEAAEEGAPQPLFDEEADAEDEIIPSSQDAGDDDEDVDELPTSNKRRARNQTAIVSDDEDGIEATPKAKTTTYTSPQAAGTQSPAVPTSVLRSAKKTFIPGLPVQGPAGLGLTQIFAGTMDDSQMSSANGPTQSTMPDFDHLPDSNFSATAEDMVVDSQRDEVGEPTQGIQLNFSQSQMRGLDSLLREQSSTQLSDVMELSQDGGFQEHTPLKDRFVEPPVSTVETVLVDQQEALGNDSPLARRGRLRRKGETSLRIEQTPDPEPTANPETAFNALNEGAIMEKKKKQLEDFNKKRSKAKEMVQEQAEESEDEYAGLGGADGEDSDDESIASVKEMIDDDAAGNIVDEAKLAAFYADRERAEDEKQVEKLFKDITTGMLRRKRGAGYDLDDSDDDGEARRRMKRRQFAKMQKALFSDERVKKIAENPGNQAFLRTIEDRGSDDDMDFLDPVDEQPVEESQSQEDGGSAAVTVPDSQTRRPLGSAADNRAPARLRRTKDGKKPSNIGEVRETLSNLLDEPHGSVIPATEMGSDSEDEARPASSSRSDKENYTPNPRRTSVAVVDRISLKRQSSSTVSTTRLAFAAASSSSFKVPALLRRATTNSLASGASSSGGSAATQANNSGASANMGGFGDEAKIKKVASKRTGVNAIARDSERHAKLQESERRREERKMKGAERRIGVVGGLLGKGTFE